MSQHLSPKSASRKLTGPGLRHASRGLIFGLGVLLAAGAATGCSRAAEEAPASVASPTVGAPAAAAERAIAGASPKAGEAASTTRKILRQGELELEVPAPSNTQTAIEQLAEQHGGYVVSAARDTDHGSAVDVRVTLVVRVPQTELTATIAALKRMGRGVGSERITSDDVTDEYVDLVARISSQKQLEQQYFEILKRANTVKDAMDVQKELAEVRTDIERMQGRQQLIDKESAFSTLTVHLSTAVPQIAVSPDDVRSTLRRGWADSLAMSADMLEGAIHVISVLVPLALFIGLPGGFGLWLLLRLSRTLNARRRRHAQALTEG